MDVVATQVGTCTGAPTSHGGPWARLAGLHGLTDVRDEQRSYGGGILEKRKVPGAADHLQRRAAHAGGDLLHLRTRHELILLARDHQARHAPSRPVEAAHQRCQRRLGLGALF